MMKLTVFALLAGAAFSFSPISQTTTRQSTQLRESFGLGVGEDTYSNQPALLRGEQEYKQFVNKYAENNMLNRKVRLYDRLLDALIRNTNSSEDLTCVVLKLYLTTSSTT